MRLNARIQQVSVKSLASGDKQVRITLQTETPEDAELAVAVAALKSDEIYKVEITE